MAVRPFRDHFCDHFKINYSVANSIGARAAGSRAPGEWKRTEPALFGTQFGHRVRVTEAPGDLPVLTIDGDSFDDFEGFQRAFSALLRDWSWNGSLDAFNDILRGGFGTPEDGFILRWLHSNRSREALGPDRFDLLVRIIRDHGPGGAESEDNLWLDLA